MLLRIVLGEPDRLRIWPKITTPVASPLIRLECLRTIDRARIRLDLNDRDVARHRADALDSIAGLTLIALDQDVLERAADPFPTLLGSLDAIHLASAVLARQKLDLVGFATHDDELATAARAVGFDVYGD